MLNEDKIRSLADLYFKKVVEIRRHLHKYPELSFVEFETSKFIQMQLSEAGIPFTDGHVKTGIVALIEGKNPGKRTLLLRADMDALPIQEQNDLPYRSEKKGIMHACGHDVHSACALGAALILNDLKDHFEGSVKIMFQPGEEVLPGGANLMIREGVLENPKVDKAIALHVFPSMETGKVGFKSGMYMASTDELYLTVKGKGGHAAVPSDYTNPLIIASEILLAINTLYMLPDALKGTPGEHIPTVVAFGKIEGMGATNIIPESVKLEGTLRTMDEAWREEMHGDLKDLVKRISARYNADAELRIERGYPFLVNDTDFTTSCYAAAENYLGKGQVEDLPLRMTAEDFAFITQKVPSCFFRLGTGNKELGITAGVHTPKFNVDESSLKIGVGLLAWLCIKGLGN